MRYQSPTSGPRSISPESPGGSGNDARFVASSSAPITPPVVANTRPNRGCRHMLRAMRKVPQRKKHVPRDVEPELESVRGLIGGR
jgi:hypothetical protein